MLRKLLNCEHRVTFNHAYIGRLSYFKPVNDRKRLGLLHGLWHNIQEVI